MKDIRPIAALTHPAWMAALVLLVFNDHFLKASGLAPALSGKLSDFVGLLVAPVLLAAVLRVRSRAGLWMSAGAIGAVFAAINLFPGVAASWDAAVSMLVPFRTTVDPTDLVALVMLPVGLALFGPAMRAEIRRSRGRRTAQYALAVVGIVMCTATSEDESCTTNADCYEDGVCQDEWCEYRSACTQDADCSSAMCAADGRCELAGSAGAGMSIVRPADEMSRDVETLEELELRSVHSMDSAELEYLRDPSEPLSIDR